MPESRETALPTPRFIEMLAGTPWSDAYEVLNDTGSPFDLTGYTTIAQARATVGGALIGTLTESLRTDALGVFTMTMPASITLAAQTAGVFTLHVDVWCYLTAGSTTRFPVDTLTFKLNPSYTAVP